MIYRGIDWSFMQGLEGISRGIWDNLGEWK